MIRKLKLVTSLSALTLTGAVALAGCGFEGEGEGAEGADGTVAAMEGEGASGVSGDGESEGEGAASAGDPAEDDIDYIYRLGMVRGHLAAFIALYRAGENDMAATHVKHPESELYEGLVPAFSARGMPGFADALKTLVDTAEAGGDVETTYDTTIAAIRANTPAGNARMTLFVVAKLASTAADEFDIGVSDDGAITDPHEYQDAYGFLAVAREMLVEIKTSDISASEAIAVAHEQIEQSLASFDGLIVDKTEGTAATIYGAAARIEIAALGL